MGETSQYRNGIIRANNEGETTIKNQSYISSLQNNAHKLGESVRTIWLLSDVYCFF
jgi:hypothetical protein